VNSAAPISELDATVRALCDRGKHDEATVLVLRAWGGAIYRFIAARVRDEDLTGDAFAEFSEDLWLGMSRFEGRASVKVWAYSIARNAAGQVIRKRTRTRRRHVGWTSTLSSRIADEIRTETRDYLQTGFKERFQELARKLTPEEHAILWLRINERMSWDDIARVHAAADAAELKREAARLRKRFQLIRAKLRTMAMREGLVPAKKSKDEG
jgi:RNA polymerase sigma-70 factor (ECF subfamily)